MRDVMDDSVYQNQRILSVYVVSPPASAPLSLFI